MKEILYFAYGSNLHQKQLAQRCPDAEPFSTALLENYALIERGFADIECADGQWVNGALYRISPADLAALDSYEGYPAFYTRKEVLVSDAAGFFHQALVYMMTAEYKKISHRSYSDNYRKICSQGCMQWGIPDLFASKITETPLLFTDSKKSFTDTVDELEKFLDSTAKMPHTTRLWQGGNVVVRIKEQVIQGAWGGFYPAPRQIVTCHAMPISWMMRVLTALLRKYGILNSCNKFSFYATIADVLQQAIAEIPDISAIDLLHKMLDHSKCWSAGYYC